MAWCSALGAAKAAMVKHSAAAFGDVGAWAPPPVIELTGRIKKKTNAPDCHLAGHKPCITTRPNEPFAPGYTWRHGTLLDAVPGIHVGRRPFIKAGIKWRLHVDFRKTRGWSKDTPPSQRNAAAHSAAILTRYHAKKQSAAGNAAVRDACNTAHVA